MGQGLYVKVAQIVAEELQVDIDRIRITSAVTDKVPEHDGDRRVLGHRHERRRRADRREGPCGRG